MRRSCVKKNIILGMVEGKRRRGRPARAWANEITELLGCTLAAAVQAAQDRTAGGGGMSPVPHLFCWGLRDEMNIFHFAWILETKEPTITPCKD